jgi:hypothetical protein
MFRAALIVTAALAVTGSALAAPDLPRRKSGLWEMTIGGPAMPGAMTMQMCVDEKTDDLARSAGGEMQANCTKNEIRRDGNRVITESVCKLGASTATTRGVFTGDFASSYSFEMKTTYEPAIGGMKDGVSQGSARWTGPCKAGMRPGDLILPNGMKMNINDRK